jgi:hypothetical protein
MELVPNPTKMGIRTKDPYQIRRVHCNRTVTIRKTANNVNSRLNIRQVRPFLWPMREISKVRWNLIKECGVRSPEVFFVGKWIPTTSKLAPGWNLTTYYTSLSRSQFLGGKSA